ncbi:hypothetical protein [Neisseria meningitidis serogroup B]|uniref:Uncharacterized protein n=2 Tax=Neisseria meningitidis TaxID=487 RepID=A0A0H5QEH1_NEIMI|nr:hypothetical protein NMALPHA522_0202 [Neisseria meningitidis alpha522]CRY99645.1 hypothetical protein [Neisseria meningitidis serogroup B]
MPLSNGLDSRLRGNDGLEVARNLKKTETEQAGFPQHSVIPVKTGI